ncbi:MAG: sigma-E processing peptidase SpoIIGA [Lachnospiraceae bacterium]|nr:sigma-E processing peptidase SpoIIGA [Lachnospiraceae bacterium]
MIYEWYIDVFFLNNFLMDAAALILAAVCCSRSASSWRVFLVSAAASAASIALLLLLPAWLWYVLAVHMAVNPLMTFLAFSPKSWKDFLSQLLSVYLLLLVAGGVQESLRLQMMLDSAGVILFSGILAMALFVLWQVRRRVTGWVCAVDLWFCGQRVPVRAYCDSGNLLRHPITGQPVSIVSREALPDGWVLSPEEADTVDCRTVGTDKSCVEIIVLDKMDVYLKGTVREILAPPVGLHSGSLMKSVDVQMLLNVAIFG